MSISLGSVPPETAGEAEVRRPRNRTATQAIGLLSAAVFLGFVLHSAQFDSSLRWGLGILFLAVLVGVVLYIISRRTESPEPLAVRPERDHAALGELSALTEVASRADRGMAFSEDIVVTRVRTAIVDHIRLNRGLSPAEMLELENDEAALRATLRDAGLFNFLLVTRDRESRVAWAEDARRGSGLMPSLGMILERAEAWR